MPRRLSINLSEEVFAVLERIAAEDGVTVTEVVRRSVADEAFFRQARADGEKLLLLDPKTEQYREVVLR